MVAIKIKALAGAMLPIHRFVHRRFSWHAFVCGGALLYALLGGWYEVCPLLNPADVGVTPACEYQDHSALCPAQTQRMAAVTHERGLHDFAALSVPLQASGASSAIVRTGWHLPTATTFRPSLSLIQQHAQMQI